MRSIFSAFRQEDMLTVKDLSRVVDHDAWHFFGKWVPGYEFVIIPQKVVNELIEMDFEVPRSDVERFVSKVRSVSEGKFGKEFVDWYGNQIYHALDDEGGVPVNLVGAEESFIIELADQCFEGSLPYMEPERCNWKIGR